MATPDLDLVRENLESTLADLLEYLNEPHPIEVEAATVQKICDTYRRLGACSLLADADADGLFVGLGHSAHAYLAVLTKVRWADVVDLYYLCTGRAAPFFDALACADLPTATAIAARSRREWAERDEYEDDFAWVRAVMALLGDGRTPAPDAPACVDRLVSAAGEDDPRAALCRALLTGAASDAEEALRRLASAYATEAAARLKEGLAPQNEIATEGRLFVPGVAVARLLLLRGMPLEGSFRLVPDVAFRRAVSAHPAAEAWRVRPA